MPIAKWRHDKSRQCISDNSPFGSGFRMQVEPVQNTVA